MGSREIESVESGLRIISYEGTEVLNDKHFLKAFFNFYFLYSGFISFVKTFRDGDNVVSFMLPRFPRILPPFILIFIPLVLYATGLFFTYSLVSFFIFSGLALAVLFAGYLAIRKRIRNDVMRIILACSEFRSLLFEFKKSKYGNQ